jgi:hypothetical protein
VAARAARAAYETARKARRPHLGAR